MLTTKGLAPLAAAVALALAPAAPAHAWWSPCDWGGCYGPGYYGSGYYGPGPYYGSYYGPGYYSGGSTYIGCSTPFNDCPPPTGKVCGPCP